MPINFPFMLHVYYSLLIDDMTSQVDQENHTLIFLFPVSADNVHNISLMIVGCNYLSKERILNENEIC